MRNRISSRVARLAIASALTILSLGTGVATLSAFSPGSASTTVHFAANNPWPSPPQAISLAE